jgi:serpin B
VEVALPRFRIESESLLENLLSKLGMQRAFSIEQADFSRMSDDPEGLFISSIVHRAFVEVNEKGTEAAAATAVLMAGGCARDPESPRVFRADHPFLFYIRDCRTRQIHFVGRVMNPGIY